jgi:DnaB-like helicase C terminal domain
MRSLHRSLNDIDDVEPLPAPFKAFERAGALIYPGALTMIAGGPGSMKTIMALNWVNRLRVPTLYLSNDSTQFTIINRVYSMLTEQESHEGRAALRERPDQVRKVLQDWEKVQFCFETNPGSETLMLHSEAFREIHGQYPKLTVLDIFMNWDDPEIVSQKYWSASQDLKDYAKKTGTAMVIAHHTAEGGKYDPCPPRSAIMGKASHLPELIITQAPINKEDGGQTLAVAVVKNRNGRDDVTGQTYFELGVEPSKFRVFDLPDPNEGLLFRDGTSVPSPEKLHVKES